MHLRAKGCQRWPENYAKKGERPGTNSPSKLSAGTKSANTLTLDFWTPGLQDNTFLLFKPPSVWQCYGSLSKLIQTGTMSVFIHWYIPSICHCAWHMAVLQWLFVNIRLKCLFNWIYWKGSGSCFCLSDCFVQDYWKVSQTPELYSKQVCEADSSVRKWPKSIQLRTQVLATSAFSESLILVFSTS